jgi:hypothetical protein
MDKVMTNNMMRIQLGGIQIKQIRPILKYYYLLDPEQYVEERKVKQDSQCLSQSSTHTPSTWKEFNN